MAELISSWVTILVAGTTMDGREVEDKDLQDIAETYDTQVYEASINADHFQMGMRYGRVAEVRLTTHAVLNKPALQARLIPNAFLLELNQQKQKLHTSCEICFNFAGTGRAYLVGLAITDQPASLGTDRIEFAANRGAQYCAPLQLTSAIPFASNNFVSKIGATLKTDVGIDATPIDVSQQTSLTPEELNPMTEEQVRELFTQLMKEHTQTAEALSDKATTQQSANNPPEPNNTLDLSGQFDSLKDDIVKLTAAVSALAQPAPSTPIADTMGDTSGDQDIF